MQDTDIARRVQELVAEEHELRSDAEGVDPERLRHVEEALDQCWDLLRQRRARRDHGEDPDDATVRPPGVVENYQQ